MSTPIKCFMLTPRERVTISHPDGCSLTTTIYEAPDGRRYDSGHGPVTLPSGEVVEPAPVGAMWDADWFRGEKHQSGLAYDRNPDGVVLCVRTPGGDWVIDGPSFTNRVETGSWSRTGTIPNVTATPSIHIPGKYHGWLRDGYLVEC